MTRYTRETKYNICMAIIVTIAIIVTGLTIGLGMPNIAAEAVAHDPFYPAQHENVAYTLTVPSLDDRLTFDETSGTATLFAPYTTKSTGWHDANKVFATGTAGDSQLCWAASDSNVIAWYLDVMEKLGLDTTSYDRDLNTIFNHFRDNWARDGYDPLMGLSWYFTSNFPTNSYPPNLINQGSGGYLGDVRGNTRDGWFNLYPANGNNTFGNYGDKFPFVQEMAGHYYEGDKLYNHESFSRNIIEQLHYGATVLTINKDNAGGASHAITLWGCDYDAETGLISKLYVTDSDDSTWQMVEIPVKKSKGDVGGVRIHMTPGLGMGDASPYTMVSSSVVLYAPNVVNAVDTGCVHSFEQGYNASGHFLICTKCGEIKDRVSHAFGAWTSQKKPTCTEVGREYRVCECGYREERDVAKISHSYVSREDDTHSWRECTVCGDIVDKKPLPVLILDENIRYDRAGKMPLIIKVRATDITNVFVDDISLEYMFSGQNITIGYEDMANLTAGNHTIKVTTTYGEDSKTFEVVDTTPTPEPDIPDVDDKPVTPDTPEGSDTPAPETPNMNDKPVVPDTPEGGDTPAPEIDSNTPSVEEPPMSVGTIIAIALPTSLVGLGIIVVIIIVILKRK